MPATEHRYALMVYELTRLTAPLTQGKMELLWMGFYGFSWGTRGNIIYRALKLSMCTIGWWLLVENWTAFFSSVFKVGNLPWFSPWIFRETKCSASLRLHKGWSCDRHRVMHHMGVPENGVYSTPPNGRDRMEKNTWFTMFFSVFPRIFRETHISHGLIIYHLVI